MNALTKTVTKLYKSYLFTVVMKDLRKLGRIDYGKQARKAMGNLEFDKKYWLHKMGLTTYSPVKTSLGSGLLFVAGAALGALAGMALAPMRGEEFRREIKHKAGEMMHRAEMGETQAPARA